MTDTSTPPAPPPMLVMPFPKAAIYVFASLLIGIAQGLGMSFFSSNLSQVQGEFSATQQEALWLVAAYLAPAALTVALVKIRTQFGLRLFAQVALACFVAAALLNLAALDLESGVVVRFLSGMAAAPISTLAFLYMLEPFSPPYKLSVGLSLTLMGTSLGAPLSRVLAPHLLDLGGWHQVTVLELALALIAAALVHLLPLTPVPREKVIQRWDFVSFPLIFVGMGSLAVALTVGRSYWWFDRWWLGVMMAGAVAALILAGLIELNRKTPLIDIRWIVSPAILQFAGALLIFRIVLAEQTSGAPGLFQTLGLQNAQMQGMFWMILGMTVLGGIVSAAVLKPGREHAIHAVALMLIIAGALMDSNSTSLTRPPQMMVSQAMIAFASALFLPAAMAAGLIVAFRKGPLYILSFIIVFLLTQRIGGALGSALFQTVLQFRQNAHTTRLHEGLGQSDPLVIQRLQTYAGAYTGTTADVAARQAQAVTTLGQTVQREATVLAYNDIFFMIACVATGALAVLLVHWALILRSARIAAGTPANG
ncbi:MFS transporter [Falsirhodobacter sp. 20TX0035]|uniref:MFS transporter n=1 Tax=Falsirhodobacter sp. 20TX0035 TaxID=3022019 RepID=UPI00232C7ECA|nr:MFS transporter [Falsirhodobacter sp. 20TX0035]MDB6454525.1 MFS transporter [Falsirhodobacter sp. 20TX0035]